MLYKHGYSSILSINFFTPAKFEESSNSVIELLRHTAEQIQCIILFSFYLFSLAYFKPYMAQDLMKNYSCSRFFIKNALVN